VAPSWKEPGKALECPSAHDHRGSHRNRLEALEVGRNVPGKLAFAADYATKGTGDDERDARVTCHSPDLPCGSGNAK
jgi:hypothetical protein